MIFRPLCPPATLSSPPYRLGQNLIKMLHVVNFVVEDDRQPSMQPVSRSSSWSHRRYGMCDPIHIGEIIWIDPTLLVLVKVNSFRLQHMRNGFSYELLKRGRLLWESERVSRLGWYSKTRHLLLTKGICLSVGVPCSIRTIGESNHRQWSDLNNRLLLLWRGHTCSTQKGCMERRKEGGVLIEL